MIINNIKQINVTNKVFATYRLTIAVMATYQTALSGQMIVLLTCRRAIR